MIDASLSVIYHSKLCPELLRREIAEERAFRMKLAAEEGPPKVKIYSNLRNLKLDTFLEHCEKAFHPDSEALTLS